MTDETDVTGEVARSNLGDRLRDLIPAGYEDDGYFGVTAVEVRELADEADRMRADVVRLDNLLIAERGVTARLRREVRGLRDRVQAVADWVATREHQASRESPEVLERAYAAIGRQIRGVLEGQP